MTSLASVRRVLALGSGPNLDSTAGQEQRVDLQAPSRSGGGPWRAGTAVQLVAAIPFLVAIGLYLVPGYNEPLFKKPPDILAIPAGFVFQVATLAWAALGAAVVWQTRFRFMAALALAACTIPAVVGVVLMPTLIEVMMALG